MKSNKGITIISLMVYIIVLSFVIGVTSMLVRYFYNNEEETVISKKSSSQYSRFVAYLTDDINSRKIDTKEIIETNEYKQIVFELKDHSIHKYVFNKNNKNIYYIVYENNEDVKYITLCEDIESCNFVESNDVLTTEIRINNDIVYKNVFKIQI